MSLLPILPGYGGTAGTAAVQPLLSSQLEQYGAVRSCCSNRPGGIGWLPKSLQTSVVLFSDSRAGRSLAQTTPDGRCMERVFVLCLADGGNQRLPFFDVTHQPNHVLVAHPPLQSSA